MHAVQCGLLACTASLSVCGESSMPLLNVCPSPCVLACSMACTGLLDNSPRHAEEMVNFAKDMLAAAATVSNPATGSAVQIRVGIHSGRVMSGIVGTARARYCLFGGECVFS